MSEYVGIKRYMGEHPFQTRLAVGNQSFDVGPRYETEKEAKWFAKQLETALDAIVAKADKPYFSVIDNEAVTTFTLNSELTPREQLGKIIDWHVQVATDPKVNGGYKLVKEDDRETGTG